MLSEIRDRISGLFYGPAEKKPSAATTDPSAATQHSYWEQIANEVSRVVDGIKFYIRPATTTDPSVAAQYFKQFANGASQVVNWIEPYGRPVIDWTYKSIQQIEWRNSANEVMEFFYTLPEKISAKQQPSTPDLKKSVIPGAEPIKKEGPQASLLKVAVAIALIALSVLAVLSLVTALVKTAAIVTGSAAIGYLLFSGIRWCGHPKKI